MNDSDLPLTKQLFRRVFAAALSIALVGGVSLSAAPSYATHASEVARSANAIRTGVGTPSELRGSGIDVAVIDTGVVPLPMFGTRLLHGPDFSSDASSSNLRSLDAFGHGTNIAGIIAGVAPAARIVSVKVADSVGSTSVTRMVGGINWVIANAKTDGRNIRVLNLSFGLPAGYSSPDLTDALRRAWRSGIVVIASAGNDPRAGVTAPASDPRIIAAGAVDISAAPFRPAQFTACADIFGRRSDVLAPGVGVVGPRVPGSYLDEHYPAARVGADGFRGSGTSQAAAALSGVAALLIAARPWLTPSQTKWLLLENATFLPEVSSNIQGYGVTAAGAAAAATARTPWDADFQNQLRSIASLGAFMFPGTTLQGSGWNGIDWSGNRWSGNRWSGNRWSGSAWV